MTMVDYDLELKKESIDFNNDEIVHGAHRKSVSEALETKNTETRSQFCSDELGKPTKSR